MRALVVKEQAALALCALVTSSAAGRMDGLFAAGVAEVLVSLLAESRVRAPLYKERACHALYVLVRDSAARKDAVMAAAGGAVVPALVQMLRGDSWRTQCAGACMLGALAAGKTGAGQEPRCARVLDASLNGLADLVRTGDGSCQMAASRALLMMARTDAARARILAALGGVCWSDARTPSASIRAAYEWCVLLMFRLVRRNVSNSELAVLASPRAWRRNRGVER